MSQREIRSKHRRKAVDRLRSEGRPVARPRLGTRHVGRRGRRRIVRDEQYEQIANLVVQLRKQGHSWNVVSDLVEEHVATLEGRKPMPRWDRTGWTKWKVMAIFKRRMAEADVPPTATRRQCSDCGRSLDLKFFDGEQKTCRECSLTAGFKRRDERRRDIVAAGILAAARAIEVGESSEDLLLIFQTILDQAGGPELFGLDIEQILVKLAREHRGSKRALDAIASLARLLAEGSRLAASKEGVPNLSTAELDREIKKELRPIVDALRCDATELTDLFSKLTEDNQ